MRGDREYAEGVGTFPGYPRPGFGLEFAGADCAAKQRDAERH